MYTYYHSLLDLPFNKYKYYPVVEIQFSEYYHRLCYGIERLGRYPLKLQVGTTSMYSDRM